MSFNGSNLFDSLSNLLFGYLSDNSNLSVLLCGFGTSSSFSFSMFFFGSWSSIFCSRGSGLFVVFFFSGWGSFFVIFLISFFLWRFNWFVLFNWLCRRGCWGSCWSGCWSGCWSSCWFSIFLSGRCIFGSSSRCDNFTSIVSHSLWLEIVFTIIPNSIIELFYLIQGGLEHVRPCLFFVSFLLFEHSVKLGKV